MGMKNKFKSVANRIEKIGTPIVDAGTVGISKLIRDRESKKDRDARAQEVKAQEQADYLKTTAGQFEDFKNKYGFEGSSDPTILQGQKSGLSGYEAMTGQSVASNKAAVQDVLGRYKSQLDKTDPVSQRLMRQGSRQATLTQMKNPNVSARALSAIRNQGDMAANESLYKTQQAALSNYKDIVNNLMSGAQQNMWAGAQLAKSGTVPAPPQQQSKSFWETLTFQ